MSKPSLSTLQAQSFRLVLSAMATSGLILRARWPDVVATTEEKLIASARAYEAKREFSAAAIELKRALDKNARSAEARLLLGKVLLEDGDPAAAVVELRKADELGASKDRVAPDLARAMLLVGQAKQGGGAVRGVVAARRPPPRPS
jgi:Flp pilus assembly protein TadD